MKLRRKQLYKFLALALTGTVAVWNPSPAFLMMFAAVLFVLIFIKAKYSFFTALAFIMLFSYLQVIIYKMTGECSGMLALAGKQMPFYFTEMSVAFIYFFLTELFFVWFTDIIENEKKIYDMGTGLNLFLAVLFLAAAILLIVLVFPSVPTFRLSLNIRRTQGISGTYGFLLLAFGLAALTIDAGFRCKIFHLGYIFIIFWVLGHGERVEVLGFFVYYMIKVMNRIDLKTIWKKTAKFKRGMMLVTAAGVALFCVWLGEYRLGASGISLSFVIRKLILQGTCGDVLYIFNCAIDMWKHDILTYGYTYIDYLLQLIPGATLEYSSAVVMRKYYFTMGGGLFFVEPMMNFGMIWTLLSNIEFFYVMRLILRKHKKIKTFMWIPVVIELFRTTWYGRAGYVLAICVEMPLLYLGVRGFYSVLRPDYQKQKYEKAVWKKEFYGGRKEKAHGIKDRETISGIRQRDSEALRAGQSAGRGTDQTFF